MEWSQIIITLITVLVPAGGITGIFLVKEKKKEAKLDNIGKIINEYQELIENLKKTIEESREREAKCQEKLDAKEDQLMIQFKLNSAMRRSMDDLHTELAVLDLMKCTKYATCPNKQPPIGSDVNKTLSRIKESSRKCYEVEKEKEHDNIESQ